MRGLLSLTNLTVNSFFPQPTVVAFTEQRRLSGVYHLLKRYASDKETNPISSLFRLLGYINHNPMKDKVKAEVKAVAGNIRKVREFRNYTQDYLAAKLEISQNAYSKIELGYSKITLDRLFQIALILEVEVTQLLYFEPSIFQKVSKFA